jgi:asparaginyl-tRNA synthetase
MEPVSKLLSGELDGREATIRGWIYRTRSSGSLVFATIRDSSGIIQTVGSKKDLPEEDFEPLKRALIESSVILTGTVQPDERAPGGRELHLTRARVVHSAETFPITKDQSEEFLLDVRHLWLRSRPMTATLKLRSTVIQALKDFYLQEGFFESQGPMFVGGQVEGGSTLFEVPYFDRKVYLTQSSQLYLEALIFSLERVFTLAPSFRAEKSRTRRHLTEYWHFEIEVAWMGNSEMMDLEERTIEHVVDVCLRDRRDDLEVLKRDTDALKAIRAPFPRLRYEEAVELINRNGREMRMGDDFGHEEERALTQGMSTPVFVSHWPREIKPLYHRPDPDDPSHVLNHDLIAPEEYGEIIGGGERIWEPDVLLNRIDEEGLDPAAYQWYIDLRRFGSVPHSGYGMGVDRLVCYMGGIDHIKWALPFPRDVRRVYP